MKLNKILIGGAGGAPSEGVIKSLLLSKEQEEVIGMGSIITDLVLSSAKKKYLVPMADNDEYKDTLMALLDKEKPSMLHCQNDLEVFYVSKYRDDIQEYGTKLFMPTHSVIDTCVSKWKSWKAFKKSGLVVPVNIYIKDENDLSRSFNELGDSDGKIWLRADVMAGGGAGAISTNDYSLAKAWIQRNNGWGKYIAAEMLTADTVTWLSIWKDGELVVAQTRKRVGWVHGNRAASGVTGVTKVGVTCSDNFVTEIAIKTVKSVDNKPNGIYGVDMTYDKNGIPNPTEINMSRFFTTVFFFTKAGLNMPVIYKDIALYNRTPDLAKAINPLPDGLMWLRSMDKQPMLITEDELKESYVII